MSNLQFVLQGIFEAKQKLEDCKFKLKLFEEETRQAGSSEIRDALLMRKTADVKVAEAEYNSAKSMLKTHLEMKAKIHEDLFAILRQYGL